MNTVKTVLQEFAGKKVQRQKFFTKLVILSMIVTLSVSWSLHLTGESKTAQTWCGQEEHTHDESCEERTLICGKAEGEQSSAEAHTHDDSCYQTESILVCTKEQHKHSQESCYDASGNRICDKEEHTHSKDGGCYQEQRTLICTREENNSSIVHLHTDECYEITYICGHEKEHTHTLSCYSNPEADVEKPENWEKAFKNITLSHDLSRDICTIAKTQLGYIESTENYQVVLDTKGNETEEIQGWNRYGAWSGDPYSSWSADFIRFCLYYSGMPKTWIPETQSCQEFADELKKRSFFTDSASTCLQNLTWMPEPGDPVFFDTDQDGKADHTGLVSEVELKAEDLDSSKISSWQIKTIEGDLEGKVQEASHDLDDASILGFGHLFDWYLQALASQENDSRKILKTTSEDGLTFTIIGEIPEEAHLEAAPLSQKQIQALAENEQLEKADPKEIKAYDIKILLSSQQEEEKIWQPDAGKPVSVSISGLNLMPDQEIFCVHLPETDLETVKEEELKEAVSQQIQLESSQQRISFQAESFSNYLFVSTAFADDTVKSEPTDETGKEDSPLKRETEADWQAMFEDLDLSGVYTQDLLTVAQTQIDYQEVTEGIPDTDEKGNPIENGYTRYGEWFGDPYGVWDAMFISFCLNYAQVPEEAFCRDSSAAHWAEVLDGDDWGLFIPSGMEYVPNPGDLIFLDSTQDGTADHVGIVRTLNFNDDGELESIETIEGDVDDKVVQRQYDAGSSTITGYGCLSIYNEETAMFADAAGGTSHSALSYNPDTDSYRAYLEYALPGTYENKTYDILRKTVIYVYAQAGETICLGSDIFDSLLDEHDQVQSTPTGADIVLVDPNGNLRTFDTEFQGTGYIGTVDQEKAGANYKGINSAGYTPHTYTVHLTGTYEVRFHSYRGGKKPEFSATDKSEHKYGGSINPKQVKTNSNDWLNTPATVGAYDVAVFNSSNQAISGRVYSYCLALNMGANNITCHLNNYIVTDDGYIYNVDSKLDPYGFLFFGNNRGIIDNTTGDSAYHSYKGKNNNSSQADLGVSIHNPQTPDTDYDKTYRIFFDEPDPILVSTAYAPEKIQELTFTGAKENNITYVGNGGYFEFNVQNATSVSLTLDFSPFNEKHPDLTDYKNVTLTAHVQPGTNTIYWDGNDGEGNPLPPAYYNDNYINVKAQTQAGEFHFTFLDVENSTYTTITRLNEIYDDSSGTISNVTDKYKDSKYTIYYNNAINTPAEKTKYIKGDAQFICNKMDASTGFDSSNQNSEYTLNYSDSLGDFAFLDLWTYTVNAAVEQVKTDFKIEELTGYDAVTLEGLVFFDYDKNSLYEQAGNDFPLAGVEVALDYYYCGTRWGIERDSNGHVTKLTAAYASHTEYDVDGNNPIEVKDYYYHNYEVRRGQDEKYYLYEYAFDDIDHSREPAPVKDSSGNAVTVTITPYELTTEDNKTKTDYQVWIPIHRTAKTDSSGKYVFPGILVYQGGRVHPVTEKDYNNVVITVTNPNGALYTLTTAETHTGDFAEDKGTEKQILKLSDIENKIAQDSPADSEEVKVYRYKAANVGYWFGAYVPPLTISKIWSAEAQRDDLTELTVGIEGYGVVDGKSYYTDEYTLKAKNGWKTTPKVLPAYVTVSGEQQNLSYRTLFEQFILTETTGGITTKTAYRLERTYSDEEDSTQNLTWKKAEVTEGTIDDWQPITNPAEYPFQGFILDLEATITGHNLYVENWPTDSVILSLVKKSAADTNQLLSNAAFELLKLNEKTDQYESISSGYGAKYMVTTDENGQAEFHGLTVGKYRLREVVAPLDFQKAEDILFEVKENRENSELAVFQGDVLVAEHEVTILDDLDEPLTSGITKYDQYDQLVKATDTIPGAQFEVYAADHDYNIKSQTPVSTVTIGTDGTAEFMAADGSRQMYISELQERLQSNYFILKETCVPNGYRAVGEAHMRIIGSGMSTYVVCDNPYESGVSTAPMVTVYAPETLQIAKKAEYDKISSVQHVSDEGVIQYASYRNNGKISGTGTLFAMVLKRCGAESDVTELTSLTFEGWCPVYGDDINGYTVINPGSGSTLEAVIQAVKELKNQKDRDPVIFTPNKTGVSMNAILTDLPGESNRYFTYMYENPNGTETASGPEYVVAYYYSTSDSIDGITKYNTVRVTSHGLVGDADDFRRYWATEIQVPDIVNALFVQKTDIYENSVDGAVFGLYPAKSDSSGNGYYVGTDSNNSCVYIRLSETGNAAAEIYDENFEEIGTGTYSISTNGFAQALSTAAVNDNNKGYLTEMYPALKASNAGVITVTSGSNTYTIAPASNALGYDCLTLTHSNCTLVGENGSAHLRYLNQGKYYLKEVYVPYGYDLNYANVEVSVTNSGVYANAGTADDGVRVGNGAGYLVSTMNVYASIGEVNRTLSYIIGKQRLYSGSDFYPSTSSPSSWEINNNNKELYLQYAGSANNSLGTTDEGYVLFDYVNRMPGQDTLRLWTETGWSDMAIYQDYAYGLPTTGPTTKYDNISNEDLSVLFSGSTFVRVTDESVLDLEMKKVDGMDSEISLSDAKFVLYSPTEYQTLYYNPNSKSEETKWVSLQDGETEADYAFITDANQKMTFSSMTNGTYYLKELEAPDGYIPMTYEVKITVKDGVITVGRSDNSVQPDNLTLVQPHSLTAGGRYVYTLSVPNSNGYELPETGSVSVLLIPFSGLVISTCSLIWGNEKRGRKRRSRR